MFRCLNVCFLRIVRSRKTWTCILGMTLALFVNGIAQILIDSNSGLSNIIEGCTSSGFIILYYIMCVISGGVMFCEDYTSGYIKFVITKHSKKDYVKSEIIASTVCGIMSMLISFIIFVLLMVGVFLLKGYTIQETLFLDMEQFSENIWFMLVFSLLGGVLSAVAVVTTAFIPNLFVGIATPILLYYMVITLTNKWIDNIFLLPSCVYFCFTSLFENFWMHWIYAMCYTGCIVYILYQISYRKILRRIEDV